MINFLLSCVLIAIVFACFDIFLRKSKITGALIVRNAFAGIAITLILTILDSLPIFGSGIVGLVMSILCCVLYLHFVDRELRKYLGG